MLEVRCRYCNQQIRRKPSESWPQYYKRQFCSIRCAVQYRRGIEKVVYNCAACGKKFKDYATNRTGKRAFCSNSCVASSMSRPKPLCDICGKPVKTHKNRYCSRKCRGASQKTGHEVVCDICGRSFYMPPHRIKATIKFYCSPQCRQESYPKQLQDMRLALRGKRLSGEGTLPEKLIKCFLDTLDIRYETEKPIGKYFIDFFLPEYNLCIEADGDYWHGNPESDKYIGNTTQTMAIERDNRKVVFLREQGYRLLRFWESDIKNSLANVTQAIQEAINGYNERTISEVT